MAGTLTISTLSDGVNSTSSTNCIQGSAKAWVNFDGGRVNTAGTIYGSFNVSSITVVTTGKYTINFTTAMPNTNYAFVGGAEYYAATDALICVTAYARTTSNLSVDTTYANTGVINTDRVNVAIFR